MKFLPHHPTSTGIGSLPFLELDPALESAFAVDIPYLPTLPQLGPEEGLLAQGPSRAWESFLRRVDAEKPSWVKLQTVGPVTLSTVQPQVEYSLSQAIGRVRTLRMLGSEVLLFIDEPSLFQFDLQSRRAGSPWERLRATVQELQSAGAAVGIHCCGPVDFQYLWELDAETLSFDAELSLDSFLGDLDGVQAWLERGGRPALGVVPTLISETWNCAREVQGCLSRFTAALGEELGRRILRESLLTPACGLGLRSVAETEAVMEALLEFKYLLMKSL